MTTPRMNRVIDLLKEAGWSKPESECYCMLVRSGPAKASRIASEIDMRKSKVYEPLKSLEEKGYVKIRDKNPKVYAAQNPRHVIGIENEKMRQRSQEILEGLEEPWEIQEDFSGEEDVVGILRGRDSKDMELSDMIDEAEESLVGADLRLVRGTRMVREKIKENAEDLNIQLIGGPQSEDLLRSLQESGVTVKKTSGMSRFSYYVADGERVLLSIQNDKATIVFEEEPVASIFMDNFEDLFRKAEDLEDNA